MPVCEFQSRLSICWFSFTAPQSSGKVRQKLFISKWKNSGTWLPDKNLQRDYRPVSSWRTDMLTGEGAENLECQNIPPHCLFTSPKLYYRKLLGFVSYSLWAFAISHSPATWHLTSSLVPTPFVSVNFGCWRSISGIIFWQCCNWKWRAWLLFFRCYDRISSISRTFESWDECKETK